MSETEVSAYEIELFKAAIEGRKTWWDVKAEEYAERVRNGEFGAVQEETTISDYGDTFPAFIMENGRTLKCNESGVFKFSPGGGWFNIKNKRLRKADDIPENHKHYKRILNLMEVANILKGQGNYTAMQTIKEELETLI